MADTLTDRLVSIVAEDAWTMARLRSVRRLGLPDWAIGAGFVRGLVWDRLCGHAARTALPDIDVLYFDPADRGVAAEQRLEAKLVECDPGHPWSVKNQARMHIRNDDPPYRSTEHALTSWLETPTCVAVRLSADDRLTVLAPYGLDDLFALRVAPTPAGRRKLAQYRERLASKGWARTWPLAEVVEG